MKKGRKSERAVLRPPLPAQGDVPEIEDAVRTPKGGLEEVGTYTLTCSVYPKAGYW